MHPMRRVLFLTGLATVLALPAWSAGPESLLHHRAPQFARTDMAQHSVNMADYKGKVVLLNFWATWCAPCQIEIPRFAEWQKSFGAKGFQVVAVSMDDSAAPVEKFLRRRPLPFPVLMGDEQLGSQYGGVLGLPITFLIDRHGIVAAQFKGEPRLAQMETEIRRLLDQK